jgi:hypothetical protein
MFEGRPQRYGTQWIDDPRDECARPWTLAEPQHIHRLRAEVGLGPLGLIPEFGTDLAADQQEKITQNRPWWEGWLASRGWRR